MFGLVIATILMLPIGLVLGRYAFRTVIAVPKYVLAPMIALMTILGTYAIQNSIEDVAIMLTLGVAAWLLGRAGFGPAPIVLGVVLGPIAEQGFVQGWLIGGATDQRFETFFMRPIAATIIVVAAIIAFYPVLTKRLQSVVKRNED